MKYVLCILALPCLANAIEVKDRGTNTNYAAATRSSAYANTAAKNHKAYDWKGHFWMEKLAREEEEERKKNHYYLYAAKDHPRRERSAKAKLAKATKKAGKGGKKAAKQGIKKSVKWDSKKRTFVVTHTLVDPKDKLLHSDDLKLSMNGALNDEMAAIEAIQKEEEEKDPEPEPFSDKWYAKRKCYDDKKFKDEYGYRCVNWAKYPHKCDRKIYPKYSTGGMAMVQAYCQISCGSCGKKEFLNEDQAKRHSKSISNSEGYDPYANPFDYNWGKKEEKAHPGGWNRPSLVPNDGRWYW